MGLANSKEVYGQKVDEACCTSVSKCRYVTVESPKWKVFSKREIRAYPIRTNIRTGCPCGAEGVCKQKVTPKGVIIHYPQKCKECESYVTVPSIGVYINKRINEEETSKHSIRYGSDWNYNKEKKHILPHTALAFKPKQLFSPKKNRDIKCSNIASLRTESKDENKGYGDEKPKKDFKKLSVRLHEKIIKKIFFSFMEKKYKPPKTTGFLSNKDRGLNNKVKIVKKRTFPPWKLDTKVTYNTKTLPNNTNGCKRRLFSKKQPQPEKPETKSETKPPLRNADSKFSKFVRKDAIKKPTDKPVKKETEKQSKKESDEKSKSKKESNKKEAKEKRESKPNEESFTIEDPPEKMQLKKDTNEKDSTKKSSNKKEFIRRIRKECHRKENEKIPPSEIGDANNQQKLANEAEPHRNEAGES